MSQNPYEYEPDIDADLFEVEDDSDDDASTGTPIGGHKHTLDGTTCPTCNIVHDVSEHFDPNEVPPAMLERLLDFLDTIPDDIVAHVLNADPDATKHAEVITAFLDFSDAYDRANPTGPVLRAIVEHLDAQTDGKITQRWRVYEYERRIIAAHTSLKSANTALDDAETNDAPEDILHIVHLLCDMMTDRLADLVTRYRDATMELDDYDPVQSVIENGTYPEEDFDVTVRKLMIEELQRALKS